MRVPLQILIIVLLFAVSCGSPPDQGFTPALPQDMIRDFNHPARVVYAVFLELLAEKDIDIMAVNEEDMTVISDFIPLDLESETAQAVIFLEEGERFINSAKYDVTAAFIPQDDNSTQVRFIVKIDKYTRGLMSYYSWKEQPTNGYIERELFAQLTIKLQTIK